MTTAPNLDLIEWIAACIASGEPGDRLPTIRQIMRQFSVGQRRVEAALAPFIAAGRIEARRGAGIVVAAPRHDIPEEAYEADVLVLYRLSDSRLARNLMQEIEMRLRGHGVTMLHVGYASEAKARSVLERLKRFRVCLLQLHFEMLSLDFVAALNAHADHLVIDGVSVTGLEVDGLGTNWREALSRAFFELHRRGHRRIAFLTSSHSARQIAMAREEYNLLNRMLSPDGQPLLLLVDTLPGEYRIDDIGKTLASAIGPDGPAFTALIAWGVVEGYLLERSLAESGLVPGRNCSVILLGSTDFPSEHRNLFDVIGNSNEDKLALFEQVIMDRLTAGPSPVRTHYLPISLVRHGSVIDSSSEVQG